jgi:hypothetical protein
LKLILAALIGGIVAGALDIVSAFVSLVPHGATEIGILHYIASGVLGPEAANAGGAGTALLGLAVHFALTTAMAGVFVIAARFLPLLTDQAWITGPLYGVGLYFLMSYVAVPLSAVEGWKPGVGWAMVGGLMAHAFYVGLPIALIAKRWRG